MTHEMIYGIGTDLIDIQRMRDAHARHGDRFLARLLSTRECEQCAGMADLGPYLAKRWAAKEAFAKALGTGIRPPVTLAGMTVTNDALGKPAFEFDEAIRLFLVDKSIGRVHLSLSDERASAVAFVVLECA